LICPSEDCRSDGKEVKDELLKKEKKHLSAPLDDVDGVLYKL
jgi:hypothetical protein